MKNKSKKTAPLYMVVGNLVKGTELNIRVMPLNKAVRKDKNWTYPAKHGRKVIPVNSLGKVDSSDFLDTESTKKSHKGYCLKSYINELVATIKLTHSRLSKKAVATIAVIAIKPPAPTIKKKVTNIKIIVPDTKAINVPAPIVNVSPFTGREFSKKDQEDIQAVNDVLAGSKNRFSVLYKRYYEIINYKFSCSLKFNKDLADDLTADLFVKVYQSLHCYKPEYTFNSWITRVAKNFLIDYTRKQRLDTVSLDAGVSSEKMKNDSEDSVAMDIKDISVLNPEENIIAAQKTALIQNAIGGIKKEGQEAINKFFFEDKTYKEIAEELNMTIGSVKSIIFRSKARLKDVIETNKVMMACVE